MATIELELDETTLRRARQLAASRNFTLEDLFKEAIERLQTDTVKDNPIIGMFSDAPELMDEITDEAMRAREGRAFRGG